MSDPADENRLGLDRPEGEDDRDLPPARKPTLSFRELIARLQDIADQQEAFLKKKEAERVAQLPTRIWDQR